MATVNPSRPSPSSAPAVLLRADASPAMGTGHVMRCLALGAALAGQGATVTLLGRGLGDWIAPRLAACGVEARPAATRGDLRQAIVRAGRRHGRVGVVLDGYQFQLADHQDILEAGARLLVLDDFRHLPAYACHLLLNQNVSAAEMGYDIPGARLLLGPRFALLRPEFLAWSGHVRRIPGRAASILVTMGGSDPANATLGALQALAARRRDWPRLRVLLGGQYPHREALDAFLDRAGLAVEVLRNVADMPALLAGTDVALGAAGTTTLEMAFLGVPLVTLTLADNQVLVAAALDASGAARSAGWADAAGFARAVDMVESLVADAAGREAMSRAGRVLVDGLGAARAAAHVLAWDDGPPVYLRDARLGDSALLLEWANHPGVRAASFTSRPIAPGEHERWYASRLASPDCLIFIVEAVSGAGDAPAGVVRFERDGPDCVISVALAPAFQGRGLGPRVIAQGCRMAARRRFAATVDAFIKLDNPASRKAFSKAGFTLMEETAHRGIPCLRMRWSPQSPENPGP